MLGITNTAQVGVKCWGSDDPSVITWYWAFNSQHSIHLNSLSPHNSCMSQETTLPPRYRCIKSFSVTQQDWARTETHRLLCLVYRKNRRGSSCQKEPLILNGVFLKTQRSLPQILQSLCRLTKEGTEFTSRLSKYFFNFYLCCAVPNSPLPWSSFCFLGEILGYPPPAYNGSSSLPSIPEILWVWLSAGNAETKHLDCVAYVIKVLVGWGSLAGLEWGPLPELRTVPSFWTVTWKRGRQWEFQFLSHKGTCPTMRSSPIWP